MISLSKMLIMMTMMMFADDKVLYDNDRLANALSSLNDLLLNMNTTHSKLIKHSSK